MEMSFSYLKEPNGKIRCLYCNKPFKNERQAWKHNKERHLGMIRIGV